jgi:membrane-associated protease RseP (regulator of RpoE activity)
MEIPEGEGARVFGFRSPGAEGEGPTVFLRGDDPCMEAGQGVILGFGRCMDGVEFEDVNPELGEYFGVEEGVLVTEVREAATLGLEPGDVVVEVDGRPVTTVERLRRILRSYDPDEEIGMRIVRKGETMEIQGRRR